MQNGGSYSVAIDVLTSQSIADIRRKIENAEDEMNERNAKVEEDKIKQAQAAAELEAQDKQLDRDLKKYEIDTRAETEIQKVMLQLENAPEEVEEDTSGADEFDYKKHKDDIAIKIKALQDAMTMHNDKMEREDKKIAVSRIKKKSTT